MVLMLVTDVRLKFLFCFVLFFASRKGVMKLKSVYLSSSLDDLGSKKFINPDMGNWQVRTIN